MQSVGGRRQAADCGHVRLDDDALPAVADLPARNLDRREGVIVEWDVTEIGDLTPYPYRLHLEQHRLTPIILGKLAAFPNAAVRFSHKATDLSQTAARLTATAATPGGTHTFEAHWLARAHD